MSRERVAAVEGWFTLDDDDPRLIGSRCAACGTVAFPPRRAAFCPDPLCAGSEFDEVPLSATGTVWSCTDARYPPPPPFIPPTDPYEPYAVAAVELAHEHLVVLGQVAKEYGVGDLAVGTRVGIVLDTLYADDDRDYLIWKWRPVSAAAGRAGDAGRREEPAEARGPGASPTDGPGSGSEGVRSEGRGRRWRAGAPRTGDAVRAVSRDRVAVLGAGMHPWGKWGRNFVDYGVAAARAALADAGVAWTDVDFVAGADTIRNGYPGFVAGATFARALGWNGARISSSYAACASGAAAVASARAQILAGLAEVALVVGADTTPKGFFAPVGGDRADDPDWLRFRLLGASNPVYFALYARRRMARHHATEEDFALVKVKNSKHGATNPNARYRAEVTVEQVLASPMVADPLRLLEICATSDGGAALVLASADYARRHGFGAATGRPLVSVDAVTTVTPNYPNTLLEFPDFATDAGAARGPAFRDSIALAAYDEAGVDPDDLDLAEVYDLSAALELDWYEHIGLCAPGDAEKLLRAGDTALGGRIPVNPSGGLSCFGEAIPAQAIAQVCELVWHLRGEAGQRQVEGARVGLAANQGLFGHASAVIVSR